MERVILVEIEFGMQQNAAALSSENYRCFQWKLNEWSAAFEWIFVLNNGFEIE